MQTWGAMGTQGFPLKAANLADLDLVLASDSLDVILGQASLNVPSQVLSVLTNPSASTEGVWDMQAYIQSLPISIAPNCP